MAKKTVEERLGALDLSVQASNGLIREMRDQLNEQNGHLSEVTADVRELQLKDAQEEARREERERIEKQQQADDDRGDKMDERQEERAFWKVSGGRSFMAVAISLAAVAATVSGQVVEKLWP